MIIREALIADIAQMQIVRNAVKENMLSDPALISDEDYEPFITTHGKGWVSEIENIIVGFSIVDLANKNIWALFLDPAFEKMGIGRRLHDEMMNWYFGQTDENVWLGTEPLSRAENFYRKAGWVEVGMHGNELKFEMSKIIWEGKLK